MAKDKGTKQKATAETEEAASYAAYKGKTATTLQARFADWLIQELEMEFASKAAEAAFRDGVRLATVLHMQFQKSPYNREANEAARLAREAAATEAPAPRKSAKAAKPAKAEVTETVAEEPAPVKKRPAKKAAPSKVAPF